MVQYSQLLFELMVLSFTCFKDLLEHYRRFIHLDLYFNICDYLEVYFMLLVYKSSPYFRSFAVDMVVHR